MRKTWALIIAAALIASAVSAGWMGSSSFRRLVYETAASFGPTSLHRWCYEGLEPMGVEGMPGLIALYERRDRVSESDAVLDLYSDLLEAFDARLEDDPSGALEPLIPVLIRELRLFNDDNEDAIEMLAKLGARARPALPALLELWKGDVEGRIPGDEEGAPRPPRGPIEDAIAAIGVEDDLEAVAAFFRRVPEGADTDGLPAELLSSFGEAAVPVVAEGLRDSRRRAQAWALHAAWKMRERGRGLAPALMRLIEETESSWLRREAAEVLDRLGPDNQEPEGLRRLLKSALPRSVKLTCALLLVKAAPGSDEPALIAALEDGLRGDPNRLEELVAVIDQLGPGGAALTPMLVAMLTATEAELQPPVDLDRLKAHEEDPNWDSDAADADVSLCAVREFASLALCVIGEAERGAAHLDRPPCCPEKCGRSLIRLGMSLSAPGATRELPDRVLEDGIGVMSLLPPERLRPWADRLSPVLAAFIEEKAPLDFEDRLRVGTCLVKLGPSFRRQHPELVAAVRSSLAGLLDSHLPEPGKRQRLAAVVKTLWPECAPAFPFLMARVDMYCPISGAILKTVGPEHRAVASTLAAELEADEPPSVCEASAVLGQIGPEARVAVPGLLKHCGTCEHACWALGRIGVLTPKVEARLRSVIEAKEPAADEARAALSRLRARR